MKATSQTKKGGMPNWPHSHFRGTMKASLPHPPRFTKARWIVVDVPCCYEGEKTSSICGDQTSLTKKTLIIPTVLMIIPNIENMNLCQVLPFTSSDHQLQTVWIIPAEKWPVCLGMPQPWSWLAEGIDSHNSPLDSIIQWIGLRENLQETMVFYN